MRKTSFVGGGVLFSVVLIAAAAESITAAPVPPVVTLIQNEPVYHENTEYVGQMPEYNVEKFSNPETLRGGAGLLVGAPAITTTFTHSSGLSAERLTKSKGVFDGPSGRETWYNLPMGGVVKIMRGLGYSEEEYPYWVREDGAKMLGDYIMVAANLELRPRGTIVETSLGLAIVADTGAFAAKDETAIDIAVAW